MATDMTWAEFIGSPGQPAKQRGTVFIHMLHAAGRHTLANSLMFDRNDPFEKPSVHPDVLAYCERMWWWKG